MTAPIVQLKRSSEPGKVPEPEDLQPGEVAINDADGVMYYKKSDGTVGNFSTDSAGDAVIQQIATEKAIIMAIALG